MKSLSITMKTGSPTWASRFQTFFRNESFTTFLIVTVSGGIGFILASMGVVDLSQVMGTFPWGILMIYTAMDLFTRLVVGTGIMEAIAVRLARWSRGHSRAVLILFAGLLFLVSAFLNNLTAVLVVLPILFVLFRAMDLDQRFTAGFFSMLLAISNLGGAASPIGDFPAIVILKSGLIDFSSYLFRALPLFAATAVVVTVIHLACLRVHGRKHESEAQPLERKLGIEFLGVQYRHVKVQSTSLGLIGMVFGSMFICWSLLPADRFPPELIAFAGLAVAVVLTAPRGVMLPLKFDLKPILTIGTFLFVASIASNSGILQAAADLLQTRITHPTQLLVAVMLLTAILTGLFSAGPTAAAMMPVIMALSEGPLHAQKHWLAIAFAASICAGSSLFLWSATAGFLLLSKVENARLQSKDGVWLTWGVGAYFKYGLVHFIVQLIVGILWVLVAIRGVPW